MTAKAVTITRNGNFGVMKVTEQPLPPLEPGHVLIRVRAAGLNFADLMAREGIYPDAPPLPCVFGYEGAGVVEKMIQSSDSAPPNYSPGSRVLFIAVSGAQADSVVVSQNQVFPIPDSMSFEEAAAIPISYLTAYQAVVINGNLRKGESILIHSAAGGVGIAAIQLAKLVPNVTIFGTASASKHEFLKSLGVHHTIDYRTQKFDEEILRITNGKGVNLILDHQGCAILKRGYDILKPPGRIVNYGMSVMLGGGERNIFRLIRNIMNVPSFSPIDMLSKNKGVCGLNMLPFFTDPDSLAETIYELLDLYKEGKVKPVLDRSFRFSEAGQAHKFINERKNVGKVLLVPDVQIEVQLEK